jgi:hypothetical protein
MRRDRPGTELIKIGRKQNSTGGNPDDRLNSFVAVVQPGDTWRCDIPNGNYFVTLSFGDTNDYINGECVDVQGVTVAYDIYLGVNQFYTVTDYYTTVTQSKLLTRIWYTAYNFFNINYLIAQPIPDFGLKITPFAPSISNAVVSLTHSATAKKISVAFTPTPVASGKNLCLVFLDYDNPLSCAAFVFSPGTTSPQVVTLPLSGHRYFCAYALVSTDGLTYSDTGMACMISG